jgi:hypothetical protein
MAKIVFRKGATIQVFNFNQTSNKKISESSKKKIVQTYVFDKKQFEHATTTSGKYKEFYSKAEANCLDCPMSEYLKCYTHKAMQTSGFFSSLRSIGRKYGSFEGIPEMSPELEKEIIEMCEGNYVRFGSYGEPVLHGTRLVSEISKVAKSWTGYTHQWKSRPGFKKFFMASVHTPEEEGVAKSAGWRSFIASSVHLKGYVNCPASDEAGFKSSCDKCGLCSGAEGKGNKSVYILEH